MNIIANGSQGHHRFTLTINETAQSIIENKSSVSYTFSISPIETGYAWWATGTGIRYSLNINGVIYSGYIPTYDGTSTLTIKSGTQDIEHNADGTKTINISFNIVDILLQRNTCGQASVSGSMILVPIAQSIALTDASNFTDEQNPQIRYSNPYGTSLTSLQACISFDGVTPNIAYREINKSASSYTFELTSAEKNTLLNATLNSNTKNVVYILKAVVKGQTKTDTKTRTFSVINANPIFNASNITYEDINASVIAITGNNQHIVQNLSTLQIAYSSATTQKGASILSYSFTLNGVTRTASASGIINFGTVDSATDIILTATVTDSRGNTATATKTITMIEYAAPSALVTLERKDNFETETHLTVDGTVSSVDGHNTMLIQYKKKRSDGSYGSLETIQDAVQVIETCDTSYNWTFYVIITDAFGETFEGEYQLSRMNFPLFIDANSGIVAFENGIKIGQTIITSFADAVSEISTSGIWTVRKWNSGIAECWASWNGSVTGSQYYIMQCVVYSKTFTFPTNLFTSSPIVNYTASVGSAYATLIGQVSSLSASSTTLNALAYMTEGTQTCNFYIHVIGRWQ